MSKLIIESINSALRGNSPEVTTLAQAEIILTAIGKTEILRDIEAKRIPVTATSFSELHDHVDANYYGLAFEMHDYEPEGEWADLYSAIQANINAWLVSGGHRRTRTEQ